MKRSFFLDAYRGAQRQSPSVFPNTCCHTTAISAPCGRTSHRVPSIIARPIGILPPLGAVFNTAFLKRGDYRPVRFSCLFARGTHAMPHLFGEPKIAMAGRVSAPGNCVGSAKQTVFYEYVGA